MTQPANPSWYPNPSMETAMDTIALALCRYDLEQINAKKTRARATAVRLLMGCEHCSDDMVLKALWDRLGEKPMGAILARYDRLGRAGKIATPPSNPPVPTQDIGGLLEHCTVQVLRL